MARRLITIEGFQLKR